jgi:hypothetical protein
MVGSKLDRSARSQSNQEWVLFFSSSRRVVGMHLASEGGARLSSRLSYRQCAFGTEMTLAYDIATTVHSSCHGYFEARVRSH